MAENRFLPIRICYICRVNTVDTYPGALRCRRCIEHPTRASLEQRALVAALPTAGEADG